MNNSKIWLVVNPTVGIPLFLGAVAVGSFSVHVAVLSNTTWVSDFLSGQPLGSGSAAIEAPVAPSTNTASVYFDEQTAGSAQQATIVLPDGRSATVAFEPATVEASAAPLLNDRRTQFE